MNQKAKDFNENEHMTCPKCNFEVVAILPEQKKIAYLFKNETIDYDTLDKDFDHKKEDIKQIQCNHVNCSWSKPL